MNLWQQLRRSVRHQRGAVRAGVFCGIFGGGVLKLLFCWLLLIERAMGQGYLPSEAVRRMRLPQGLEARLAVSEPRIAQPVCIEFDDRGRLWVIQYLQYPNPAGLKRSRVDRWSRTRYDQVPAPPPHGPQGADRITILEDQDGDGLADESHDFVSDLNLATGLAFGHRGVFVLNVPYLLFYPDANRDDIPDGDPVVCLSGFGMEDAHSVANSLTWGPDGWLYGCQGSTVTSMIRGIEFQQGVWRYHPLTREFELFCEGGGNSWGLDFDASGELIYSTNVGPYRNLHGVQGGYYWKSFGKHGGLHNPHAYGYFDHIPHANFTGGHVTVGGLFYSGTNLPSSFRGRYVAGDLLGHTVQWHAVQPLGSTFTSSHGGTLLEANDTWFGATDVTMSPDGAVYVSDWCDARTAHPDPDAEWDRLNGRVYRIAAVNSRPALLPDLAKLSTPELIALMGNQNDWFSRRARRFLADRRDPEAIQPLRALVFDAESGRLALEAFWGLYVSGGLTEDFAAKCLHHRNAAVRKWTVRLLADERRVPERLVGMMARMALVEPDVTVRAQLASSAARLPPNEAMPVVENLLTRDVDGEDRFIPLLLWWAVERQSVAGMPGVAAFFSSPAAWASKLVRDGIHERLTRRWIAEESQASGEACARLLASAPDDSSRRRLLAAVDLAFRDRPKPSQPLGGGGLFARTAMKEISTQQARASVGIKSPALAAWIAAVWRRDTMDPALISVACRLDHPGAAARARELVSSRAGDLGVLESCVRLLGDLGAPADINLLCGLLGDVSQAIQISAVDALGTFDDPSVAQELARRYQSLPDRVRARARLALLNRKSWARELLSAVESGRIPSIDISHEQLGVIAIHKDPGLDERVRKIWGRVQGGSSEEKLAVMRRLNNDLNAGIGEPSRGRRLFVRLCAPCHALFGEGRAFGPDLTFANRTDREFLLASLVDPSAVIRREFLGFVVETQDGRALSGLVTDEPGGNLALMNTHGERVLLPRSQVLSVQESSVSLMPEDLLLPLTPVELRDLFSYLQQAAPIPSKP